MLLTMLGFPRVMLPSFSRRNKTVPLALYLSGERCVSNKNSQRSQRSGLRTYGQIQLAKIPSLVIVFAKHYPLKALFLNAKKVTMTSPQMN